MSIWLVKLSPLGRIRMVISKRWIIVFDSLTIELMAQSGLYFLAHAVSRILRELFKLSNNSMRPVKEVERIYWYLLNCGLHQFKLYFDLVGL